MDQLLYASFFHTHYWHEVGMLKVPANVYYTVVQESVLIKYCCSHLTSGASTAVGPSIVHLGPKQEALAPVTINASRRVC